MNKTKIESVKNPDGTPGYSLNPITGCLNHVDGKCKGGGFPCWAYGLANGRLKERYLANENVAPNLRGNTTDIPSWDNPFYPRFWPEKLYHPWNGKPKGIFVCDMSDLFGIGIPEEWTKKVLNLCRLHTENRYYLLTKQPQNLIKFSPFPQNVWLGVTMTSETILNDAYHALSEVDAKVKYLSIEPLLDWKTLAEGYCFRLDFVDWVIIGAQSKPTIMPKIEWVQEIVQVCDKAGIPVFLKDSLNSFIYGEYGGKYKQVFNYAQDGGRTLRQEMPK